jgi:hypothetical protein
LLDIYGFDVTLFANLIIPDDALTSSVIVAIRDMFNAQLRPRIKFLTGNFQSTIIATPDLAVATAGDHTDVGCLLTDLCFDSKADPMVTARHYGRINLPMNNMVKPGFGPTFGALKAMILKIMLLFILSMKLNLTLRFSIFVEIRCISLKNLVRSIGSSFFSFVVWPLVLLSWNSHGLLLLSLNSMPLRRNRPQELWWIYLSCRLSLTLP